MINIMITGDSELTAAAVGHQTKMTSLPNLLLSYSEESGLEFEDQKQEAKMAFEKDRIAGLASKYTLCMTGDCIDKVISESKYLIPHFRVFARCSPSDKELVLITLSTLGYHTLMCGDGTNDVGALKQSDVGVALVFDPAKKPVEKTAAVVKTIAKKPDLKKKAVPKKKDSSNNKPVMKDDEPLKVERVTGIAIVDKFLALSDKADKLDESHHMNMGDASIAAPFTVRSENINPVLDIIRQGRCSLVTTLQMYFILALNCLISAFSLSVLRLKGVRSGDAQMTITVLISTCCFLFITRSKPLQTLTDKKPKAKIFTMYFMTSLILQFVVHLTCLLLAVHFAETMTIDYVPSFADEFAPNVLNSCVFLISASMQVATFTVNYQGHPFMQSLSENKPLRNTLTVGFGVIALASLGVLNSAIALSPLQNNVRYSIVGLMVADLLLSYLSEKLASLIFSKYG